MSSTSSAPSGPSIEQRQRLSYLLLATLSPLCLLGLWVLATQLGWVRSVLLPSPAAVLTTLHEMVTQGYGGIGLATHIGASLMRVGTAFFAGSVLGIIIGMWRGRVAHFDALWLVPSELLRPIPPLGLIPLFILWFGIGELSKILLIFLSVFLIMMINAQAGARSCAQDALRAAKTLGANRLQIFRHVVLPSALPQIVTGLRVALGTALSILVASELLGGDRGLGFIVLDASNFFRTAHVFSGIAIIGAIGLVSDRALASIGRRLVHWEGKR